MAQLHLHNLTYRHENGDLQFDNINFSLQPGRTALIGNNGVGKSLLLSLINGELEVSSGSIEIAGRIHSLEQDTDSDGNLTTVIDLFGLAQKLEAIDRIKAGSIDPDDFDAVADDWNAEERIQSLIAEASIMHTKVDLKDELARFSGGELMKLRLIALFSDIGQDDIVILDEPSNHLDVYAKTWLISKLQSIKCKCLLISHDKALLDICHQIAELKTHGLVIFSGSFDSYLIQRQQKQRATEKEVQNLASQKKLALQQAQRDREKAQKRTARGERSSAGGGLPKVIANARGAKAENSSAKSKAKHEAKEHLISEQLAQLKPLEKGRSIKLGFLSSDEKKRCLLRLENYQVPHMSNAISLVVNYGQKWHLAGRNGSGKSVFLKSLSSSQDMLYVDQNCSLVKSERSLLENLSYYCSSESEVNLRTLLAGNGFRGNAVSKLASSLSGGEKMRLAMLIAGTKKKALLLLDEPDNHLDLESKELLAEALSAYEGSFILVSHDEYFVSMCGITDVCDALVF